ncbi:sensor histidine kinase [Flavisolibacter nicotianae]|uniref:sensor histidine kinase n=1 Tax=Flavisolibacter nicotianae TaxID=2364882 RepID=UPI0013C4386F|nr:histidine kinase [Flavisolibacter nicotianae]
MPRFFHLFFSFFLACACQLAVAQATAVDVIPHQPSPEAYDLLRDSKGYLWVGHNLGISRYDGSQFINLHNPRQNSLSLSDLMEDKRGRIWCHNFGGQIFYVENLQLHLLTQYKSEEEYGFPRMIICGDELIATSAKGLFVYNTVTDQAKYYSVPKGTSSLTKVGNKIICYSNSWEWYCYEAGKPISKLKTDLYLPNQGSVLQNVSLNDTFYLTTNKTGHYYKLTLENNAVKLHSANKLSTFINTISVDFGQAWVHTWNFSFTTDGKDSVRGQNLSDLLSDAQGHRWMSSLKAGLCVQYNVPQARLLQSSLLNPKDYIRSMHTENNEVLWGMTSGKLYRFNGHSSLQYVLSVPKQAGAIENIASLGNGQLLIAASIGLYYYDGRKRSLNQVPIETTVKDISENEGKVYIATTAGIKFFPLENLHQTDRPFSWQQVYSDGARCRSIAFTGDSLIAVFNTGTYIIRRNNFQPLLYKHHPIYASRVRNIGGKIVIATFGQGVLVLENGTLRNLTEKEGLASNTVMDIKSNNGTTWLIYTDRFQQLNQAATSVEDYAFPYAKIDGINQFAYLNNCVYVSTTTGVFCMQITKPAAEIGRATYIDRILVNGKENNSGRELHHNENFLQFQVSTPYFSPYSHILYQYRIKNAPDSAWQRGASGQTAFTIAALEPGSYDFEVVATDESRRIVSSPAEYHFEILPPWYQRLVFKIGLGILVAGSAFYLVWLYYRRRLRKQRQEYEKLLVIQAERQRISSEIHDDVGAGLSAVRLLTELTRNKLPDTEARQEVGKIHASLSELSYKMREVIWSLNADNDNLENLLYYLRRQARQLFENSPIDLQITFPAQDIPDIVISGEKRRHIYLAVKEALHNSLKHSEATTCELSIRIEGRFLRITVVDDGKGFVPLKKETASNGLNNMKRRIQEMNGQLEIWSQEKTVVAFRIPLTEKHA